MEPRVVKISRSADSDSSMLALTFICVCCGIVGFVQGIYLAGALLFILAGAIFTFGERTLIDFEQKTIKKVPIAYFIQIWNTKIIQSSEQFDSIVLTQRSETGGSQFGVHSSSFTIREYHITLSSSNSSDRYKLPVFEDYKAARLLILRMKKEWGYSIEDTVYNKIQSNKQSRNR